MISQHAYLANGLVLVTHSLNFRIYFAIRRMMSETWGIVYFRPVNYPYVVPQVSNEH